MFSKPSVYRDEHILFTPAIPNTDAIEVVFAFPNTYAVGITSLGYQMVWANLASRSAVAVYRWFTDVQEHYPQHLDLLGFSFSWELDYVNILNLLSQLDIPFTAAHRSAEHPFVFGGGPVLTANPEPFAQWFDFILLGDGEELIGAMIDAYQEVRQSSRQEQLQHLAQVPGIYVPQGYEVVYHSQESDIATIEPINHYFPGTIVKQTYRGNVLSASTVVTRHAAWESIYMVEVVRSCPEMCRFCLASYLTLPFRSASIEASLIPAIDRGLAVTHRLGLLGASITQHPEFEVLLDYLSQPQFAQLRISLSSVRTNTLSRKLASLLAQRDSRSVTIAIESGSERLRQIIHKKLHNDEILAAAENAQAGGLQALKLYGMVGVPGEIPEDIDQTIALLQALKKAAPKLRLTLGCSTFVPKSHTPWQWFGVSIDADRQLKYLQKQLGKKGLEFRPESYKDSLIQALLSRGDRRLTPLLELIWQYSSGSVPSDGMYRRAFKELNGTLPPISYFVHDSWPIDRVLPWQHLRTAISGEQLRQHYDHSQQLFRPEKI